MTDLGTRELHLPDRDEIKSQILFLKFSLSYRWLGVRGIAVALLVPLQYHGQRGERDIPKLTVNRPPFPEASMRGLRPLDVHSRKFTSD